MIFTCNNKRFQITKISRGARNREYIGAMDWLNKAGIINICYSLSSLSLPLKGNYNPNLYKVYYRDTGLLVGTLDDEMLALKSINLDDSLKNTESALFSINDKTAGYVKISYAALSGVPSYVTVLEVTFVVIKDKTTRTQIEFTSSAIYDSDLNAYNGSKVFVNVDTEEIPKVITYPKVLLNVKSVNASEVELEVIAEKDTLLAAGDFFIEFNSNEYECTEIIKTLNYSMIVGNISFKTNKVRFSFIYENGISEDSVIARIKFKVIAPCETVSEFILDGSKLTDKDFNEQTVEYVNTTIEIPHNYSNEFTVDKVSTCTENGIKSRHCTRCNKTTDVTLIPTLGHDLIHHEKLDPTCTTKGHTEYDTCSRCDYSNYEELPALGHISSDWIVDVEATTNANGHKHKECTICHEHLKEMDIPKTTKSNCNLSNTFRYVMNSLVVLGFMLFMRKRK